MVRSSSHGFVRVRIFAPFMAVSLLSRLLMGYGIVVRCQNLLRVGFGSVGDGVVALIYVGECRV